MQLWRPRLHRFLDGGKIQISYQFATIPTSTGTNMLEFRISTVTTSLSMISCTLRLVRSRKGLLLKQYSSRVLCPSRETRDPTLLCKTLFCLLGQKHPAGFWSWTGPRLHPKFTRMLVSGNSASDRCLCIYLFIFFSVLSDRVNPNTRSVCQHRHTEAEKLSAAASCPRPI